MRDLTFSRRKFKSWSSGLCCELELDVIALPVQILRENRTH